MPDRYIGQMVCARSQKPEECAWPSQTAVVPCAALMAGPSVTCWEALDPHDRSLAQARQLYEATIEASERIPWAWIEEAVAQRVSWRPGQSASHPGPLLPVARGLRPARGRDGVGLSLRLHLLVRVTSRRGETLLPMVEQLDAWTCRSRLTGTTCRRGARSNPACARRLRDGTQAARSSDRCEGNRNDHH
jgi:hypothetical protein